LPADDEWRWRFRVLNAEILMRQGKSKESLEILEEAPPAKFASTDIAIRRRMAQGAASSFLNRFDDSEGFLKDAESLARESQPALLGEICLRKGTLAFLRGNQAEAQSEYRQALLISRTQSDPFLEAASLGSLGLVATKQEHYDESIDWDQAALQLSQSIGAKDSVAFIMGNMGWSYFEMGDYDRSLALFKQADDASARLGSTSAHRLGN
jgi:tetratricopeptide (TPR) repeat protein